MRVPQCQKGEGRSCRELTLSPKRTDFEHAQDVLPALLPAPTGPHDAGPMTVTTPGTQKAARAQRALGKSFWDRSPTCLSGILRDLSPSCCRAIWLGRGRGREERATLAKATHVPTQAGLLGAGRPRSPAERGSLSSRPHPGGSPFHGVGLGPNKVQTWMYVSHDEKHKGACKWSGLRLNPLKKKNGTWSCGGGCGGVAGTSHPGPQGRSFV